MGQVFWSLEKKLAQRKHFSPMSWGISLSECIRIMQRTTLMAYTSNMPGAA
jgi:vacuolar-type H+-ATPase catalytic subunit A/Vma1